MIVLVALMLTGLVAVVGLAADGGIVFAQRRDLQNVADAAALAGAMQLDERAYRESGTVTLDAAVAEHVATQYLADTGDLAYTVAASETGVEVQASRQASTSFLRVIGIDGVEISASARTETRHGIDSPDR
ncbi:MAG: pilus assembly protein TadG-related protein [Dehalococcoidia bacterium]